MADMIPKPNKAKHRAISIISELMTKGMTKTAITKTSAVNPKIN
jgi:hypothetical protein